MIKSFCFIPFFPLLNVNFMKAEIHLSQPQYPQHLVYAERMNQ